MTHRGNSSSRTIAGMDWASEVRAFGQTLARTQWLSPEDLQAYQAPLVTKLLLHAQTTTKFYKDRLDADLRSPAAVNHAWSGIPVLTRAEAVKNRLKLMSHNVPWDSGPISEGRTSGATGHHSSLVVNRWDEDARPDRT